MTDQRRPCKLRVAFIDLLENFLSSVHDVFPECTETDGALQLLRALVKGDATREDDVLRKCHVQFKEHAEALQARDAEALLTLAEESEMLSSLRLREKWFDPDFTDESREHLWQYVAALKTYSDLYVAVPQAMLGKIELAASDLTSQIRSGKLDLQNLDLAALGKSLMGDFSPEELKQFEGQLPQLFGSVASVVSSLGTNSATGLDASALLGQLTRPEDLMALVQQLGPTAARAAPDEKAKRRR